VREVKAEMAGIVVRVPVPEGGRVTAGDELVVLESMKMEIPVRAGEDGTVEKVLVRPGDFVQEGDPLVVLAP
jgi:acetyl-CoA carboxylase biotin carboxyl carrier protein